MIIMGVLNSCSISYKFNGASIDYATTKTISVADFTNNAALVYAPLATNLTDGIKDLYQRQTRLEIVRRGGNLELEGEITGYQLTPMAVSADYSFIVPSATMVIHPVRTSGTFIGVAQSYRNIIKIQDRISGFVERHSRMSQKRFEELLLDNTQLVKDIGTMLSGEEAVKEGLINEIGGMKEALAKLYELIDHNIK